MSAQLPEPIRRYLAARIPGRQETLDVETYLSSVDEHPKSLIWSLLEMLKQGQVDSIKDSAIKSAIISSLEKTISSAKGTNNYITQELSAHATARSEGNSTMSNQIHVGGNAIINIDSFLNNINQSIDVSSSLKPDEQSELKRLTTQLANELKLIESSHREETLQILDAVKRVADVASKPASERRESILKLTAKGLTDAAELVGKIAPTVLQTAVDIGKFVIALNVL